MVSLHSSLWVQVTAGDVMGVHYPSDCLVAPIRYEQSGKAPSVLENGDVVSHNNLSSIVALGINDKDMPLGYEIYTGTTHQVKRLPSLITVIENSTFGKYD